MDKRIELGVVPGKEYKIVTSAAIARKLLKDGFVIADIKPKRGHERETIFVFEIADGFIGKLEQYAAERRESFGKKTEEK